MRGNRDFSTEEQTFFKTSHTLETRFKEIASLSRSFHTVYVRLCANKITVISNLLVVSEEKKNIEAVHSFGVHYIHFLKPIFVQLFGIFGKLLPDRESFVSVLNSIFSYQICHPEEHETIF